MWLSDGSYELVTGKEDCLKIIEERLGYEMREYLEILFDEEIENYESHLEKEIEGIAKSHREQMKMIDTLYHMMKGKNNERNLR